ncbi:diaminopimelate decarboxylase [Myroides sp. LJL119]
MQNIVENLQKESTPLYYYDLPLLRQTVLSAKQKASQYGYHIHYAIKANNNPVLLKEISKLGLGADCVSGKEIELAIANGFAADQIVFAGVGKTDKEITTALKAGILAFNVESVQELQVIGQIAQQLNTCANIALRINPNVDAKTHHYITTGLEENKFGIMVHQLDNCLSIFANNPQHLNLIGLHFHVGSQITDLEVFKNLCVKVNQWNEFFIDKGITVPILNLGGGLGINYTDPDKQPMVDFGDFFDLFNEFLEPAKNQQVHFELGRSIVGNCGSLISRVLYIKNGINKNFAILDAGMTELLRPALYQAVHKLQKLNTNGELPQLRYDVVGPICESSDCFGKDVILEELHRGDLIAIRSAGAYGEVMSSRYNLREELNFYYKQ